MANPIGLYLHIPFCRGKCPYCDFYSMRADAACMDTYTQALQKSLEQWAERIGRAADTLYLGGGTPSLLGGARIAALVQTARDCYGLRGAGSQWSATLPMRMGICLRRWQGRASAGSPWACNPPWMRSERPWAAGLA